MRQKRSRTHRKHRKRRLVFYRSASLLALTTLGMSQLVIPTHALHLSQKVNTDNTVGAAFVFPKTVQQQVQQAIAAAAQLAADLKKAALALTKCQQAKSSKDASSYAEDVKSAVAAASSDASRLIASAKVLEGYQKEATRQLQQAQETLRDLQRQQHNGETDRADLAQKIIEAQHHVLSAQRVYDYVQIGFASGNAYAAGADGSIKLANDWVTAATNCVKQKQDEEKKAEEEEKAKKEAEEQDKQDGQQDQQNQQVQNQPPSSSLHVPAKASEAKPTQRVTKKPPIS